MLRAKSKERKDAEERHRRYLSIFYVLCIIWLSPPQGQRDDAARLLASNHGIENMFRSSPQ